MTNLTEGEFLEQNYIVVSASSWIFQLLAKYLTLW